MGAVFLSALTTQQAAHAQSLFDALFGWTTAGPKPQTTRPRPRRVPPTRRWRTGPDETLLGYGNGDPQAGSQRRRRAPRRKVYRTLCVRVCDGYYFPVSFAATRDAFVRDSNVCHARCGYMATLFVTASPRGEIGSAVDLDGRKYTDLADAYRYRKTYVKGCQCRPPPWSKSERARHASYQPRDDGTAPAAPPVMVLAGNYDNGGGVGLADPEPASRATVHGEDNGGSGETGAGGQGDATSDTRSDGRDGQSADGATAPRAVRSQPDSEGAEPQTRRLRERRRADGSRVNQRRRKKRTASNGSGFSLFGTGGAGSSTYRWPGD